MLTLLLEILVYGGAILLASRILPGMKVKDYQAAVWVAVLFAVLNAVLGWALKAMVGFLLFLPGILTCGLLFGAIPLLVNAILLWMADKIMDDLEIRGMGPLLGASLFLAVAQALVHGRSLRHLF